MPLEDGLGATVEYFRGLDPAKPTMTIDSVSRAAEALGARLEMKVVPRRTPARPPSKPKRKAA